MDLLLTAKELRVLGCLLEKEMATPDYYPLSLNALVNACNQKTNRDPVVEYDEPLVREALLGLKEKGLVWQSDAARVTKYSENFVKTCKLLNREAAVLCMLMLRGPQTVGELRGRTERLHEFEDLEAVAATLDALAEMNLVKKLARQPGCKESRHAHLLAGEPEQARSPATPAPETWGPPAAPTDSPPPDLAREVAELRQELETLKREFAAFRDQF